MELIGEDHSRTSQMEYGGTWKEGRWPSPHTMVGMEWRPGFGNWNIGNACSLRVSEHSICGSQQGCCAAMPKIQNQNLHEVRSHLVNRMPILNNQPSNVSLQSHKILLDKASRLLGTTLQYKDSASNEFKEKLRPFKEGQWSKDPSRKGSEVRTLQGKAVK